MSGLSFFFSQLLKLLGVTIVRSIFEFTRPMIRARRVGRTASVYRNTVRLRFRIVCAQDMCPGSYGEYGPVSVPYRLLNLEYGYGKDIRWVMVCGSPAPDAGASMIFWLRRGSHGSSHIANAKFAEFLFLGLGAVCLTLSKPLYELSYKLPRGSSIIVVRIFSSGRDTCSIRHTAFKPSRSNF